MRATGFILQSTYRIVVGRPVVHLYGRHADGSSFLIRDHRQHPHFFVPESARKAALEAGATHIDVTVLGIGERNGITPLGGFESLTRISYVR